MSKWSAVVFLAVTAGLNAGCWHSYTFQVEPGDAAQADGAADAPVAGGQQDGGADAAGAADAPNAAHDDTAPAPDTQAPPIEAGSAVDTKLTTDLDPEPDTAPPPASFRLTPAPLIVQNAATAIVTVHLPVAAGPGGVVVTLTSSDAALLVPTQVTVPAGQDHVGFRVRATAAGATATITATQGASMATAAATTTATIAPPMPGDLVINEINYDVAGDANCDGVSNPTSDEFVELTNVSSRPLAMQGVELWDEYTYAITKVPRFSFPTLALGAGESALVYGGVVGTTGTAAWCTGLDGQHVGDAIALGAVNNNGLALDNNGDTVRITTAPPTGVSVGVILDAVPFPAGVNEAWVRSPDFTGAFGRHSAAPGHSTNRSWTPGTLLTGAPFSAANP